MNISIQAVLAAVKLAGSELPAFKALFDTVVTTFTETDQESSRRRMPMPGRIPTARIPACRTSWTGRPSSRRPPGPLRRVAGVCAPSARFLRRWPETPACGI